MESKTFVKIMEPNAFQAIHIKHQHFQILISMLKKATQTKEQKSFWKFFLAHGQAGFFDDLEVFKGLFHTVRIWSKLKGSGNSLAGTPFDLYFDNFSTTLASISPQGYRLFLEKLSG